MNQANLFKPLRKCILIFLLLALNMALWAQQDTLYYNAKWRSTVKDSASFFRPPVKKEGDLFQVQDYYISGQIQMNAQSKSAEKDLWQGKVTWYNEDGSVFQEATYENKRLEGEYITFMGDKKLVAKYTNGRFVSGQRNVPYGSRQMYFEQEGDTLYEILYEKDITGIREEHYGTKDKYRFSSRYYGENGILIGERTLLPNNYYKGVEVFYYQDPMRVKEINYYPFGQLLVAATYYSNGQIREEVKQEPEWSKTYYSKDGKTLGKIVYQLHGDRLKPKNGTEMYFDYSKTYEKNDLVSSTREYENGIIVRDDARHENGKISSETRYKDGTRELQVSYDENGNEINRMVYKDYRPFDGTEIQRGRTATYKSGELVEETNYYLNSKLPRVKKTKTLETYYDKNGVELGSLKLKDDNGYPVPFEGQRFTMDYSKGDLSGIEEFKEGIKVKQTSFRKRLVGKDTSKTFKRIEEYGPEGYKKTKEIKFYSNGNKQSEITYKGYSEVYGLFYDENEKLLGSYDYEKKDGTRYKFFGDSDQLEVMEVIKEGKQQRLKRYNYGKNTEYGQINPVLEQDIDIDCCATYYNIDGDIIAKLTFKNQIPWEGTAYDHSARTKYTIKEGKRHGTYQKLDYNQSIMEEGQYADDKREGTFKYYDYQDNLTRIENFSADKLNGKSIYYAKDGTVLSKMTYKDGLPVTGTKTVAGYSAKAPNQETYKDGMLIEYVSYDMNGKNVTTYTSKKESETVSYYKDSNTKRLSYGISNSSLDGAVIRYDFEGKEQHRAMFKNGKMESGTIYLLPRYQDKRVLYMEVIKDSEKLNVKFIDFESKVVLKAEELLISGSTSNYLDKLDVNLDYLTARRLY